MIARPGGFRILLGMFIGALMLSSSVSQGGTIFGQALRAGRVTGYFCYTNTNDCLDIRYPPSSTDWDILVTWRQSGVFGLGGQAYVGMIPMSAHGRKVATTPTQTIYRLDRFSFTGASVAQGITGSCTGSMIDRRPPGELEIALTCTGQISGGSVATGKFMIVSLQHDSLACLLDLCDPDDHAFHDFDGVYIL